MNNIKNLAVYEDEYIIAINKPSNLLVHPSRYARNITSPTLIEIARDEIHPDLDLIHRLDRKTSGIILLSKSKAHIPPFQKQMQLESCIKNYYGIVRGYTDLSGIIDFPIRADETTVYKDALTLYKTIDKIELEIPVIPYDNSRYSLIQLSPKTGRMHQLRKHLNKIAHPIVGDHKYGDRNHNKMFVKEFKTERLFLHAYSLKLMHPYLKKEIYLKADFDAEWKAMFDQFSWRCPCI